MFVASSYYIRMCAIRPQLILYNESHIEIWPHIANAKQHSDVHVFFHSCLLVRLLEMAKSLQRRRSMTQIMKWNSDVEFSRSFHFISYGITQYIVDFRVNKIRANRK